jgi:hypothetical protein
MRWLESPRHGQGLVDSRFHRRAVIATFCPQNGIRGPSNDLLPRSIFSNCGISSRRVRPQEAELIKVAGDPNEAQSLAIAASCIVQLNKMFNLLRLFSETSHLFILI